MAELTKKCQVCKKDIDFASVDGKGPRAVETYTATIVTVKGRSVTGYPVHVCKEKKKRAPKKKVTPTTNGVVVSTTLGTINTAH